MHRQTQELQRYLDGELGSEDRTRLEQHLAECSTCRARLAEWQTLTTVLQSWTVPPDLTQLERPLSLPAREAKPRVGPGLIGWTSGLILALLFVLVRAIFLLSNQLNWAVWLAARLGIDGQFAQLASSLWRLFMVQPFYLSHPGQLGEKIMLVLVILLPLLLYVLAIGFITILYLNWFSLVWLSVRQSNKIRS